MAKNRMTGRNYYEGDIVERFKDSVMVKTRDGLYKYIVMEINMIWR